MADPRPRVLVIRGGAIGDFILTVPALQLLREELPDPHLEILGYPPVTALALAAGIADGARPIEHAGLAKFFVPGADLDSGWSEYFASFDLVVSFLFDPDGYFRTNVERSGVETFLQGPGKIDVGLGLHAARQLAKPLEEIALFLDDPAPRLAGNAGTRRAGSASPPLVALHPGSGSPSKNWGFENWVAVAVAIRDAVPDARFLVATGEAEHDNLGALTTLLETAGIRFDSHHGRPLTELADALAGADLFLGHDSGISHLAAAVGLPCLLVFGPTDPAIWAPQNPGVKVLQAPGGDLSRLGPPAVVAEALAALGKA